MDTLYIIPESFLDEDSTKKLPAAFPKATTANLDLQDTFIAVTQDVKDSLDGHLLDRAWLLKGPREEGAPSGSGASGSDESSKAPAADSAQPQPAQPPVAPAPAAPQAPQPSQPLQPQPQPPQQEQHPIAALAAAFAAGLLNGNAGAALAALQAPGVPGAPGAPAGLAAPQPPPLPTVLHAAISPEPLPTLIPDNIAHLRVRVPDSIDIASHNADLNTSWTYVADLLGNCGSRLQSLSLSTAPGPSHITMLSPLTQLTSLTMDEASHAHWGTEHIPIVGSLTNLRNLTIKIPPYRPARPDPVPANPAAAAAYTGSLAPLTALNQLTKLHISALRYTYHSSVVAVLPHLTRLQYLALRAPQTRLPWPGTERPLFAHVGLLTGLTQLSLSLGDHNMVTQNWQLLTTLTRLSSIELSVSEGSDGLNVPPGLEFPALVSLKLRYPNRCEGVRVPPAGSGVTWVLATVGLLLMSWCVAGRTRVLFILVCCWNPTARTWCASRAGAGCRSWTSSSRSTSASGTRWVEDGETAPADKCAGAHP